MRIPPGCQQEECADYNEQAERIAALERRLRMAEAALAYAHSEERKECLRLMADFIRTETRAERARLLPPEESQEPGKLRHDG